MLKSHGMLDSIRAHQPYKKSICKVVLSSLIMVLGVPNMLKICFCTKFTTILASLMGHAIASTT